MESLKILLVMPILIVFTVSGCKSESSGVESAMKRFADMWPTPRTYIDCSSGEKLIREIIMESRDKGDSVDGFIKNFRLMGGDEYFSKELRALLLAIWDSKESADALGDMYLRTCLASS